MKSLQLDYGTDSGLEKAQNHSSISTFLTGEGALCHQYIPKASKGMPITKPTPVSEIRTPTSMKTRPAQSFEWIQTSSPELLTGSAMEGVSA